jgi:hypothetical protein
MTSRALTVPTIRLQPHPPPYGELRLRKGAWDQLQANRAYQETFEDKNVPPTRKAALDLKI